MKKVFQYLFLSVIVSSLVSCTSDNETATPVLLKKLTSLYMGKNSTYTFTYNGTKIRKVAFEIEAQTDGRGYDLFTYSGTLVVQIKRYNTANQNIATTTFTYNSNNQLIQAVKVELANNYGFKNIFTYNPDGSVTVTGFFGNSTAQNNPSNIVENYYFINGEVSQKTFTSNVSNFDITYTYDNANHSLQNVTGVNAIKLYEYFSNGLFGMQHNVVQQSINTFGEINEIILDADYNSNNYPVALYSADGQYHHQFTYFE